MSHKAISESVRYGVYCVLVAAECDICHVKKTFNIPESEWLSWTRGGLIQNVMPSVPEDDRELLISGSCGTCFDKLFEGREDEEEDDPDEDYCSACGDEKPCECDEQLSSEVQA